MKTAKQWLWLLAAFALVLTGVAILLPAVPWFHTGSGVEDASARMSEPGNIREIHLFTVEFKARMDGKEREVYRFDPGTVIIRKGERVRLHIHGFHGKEHHFVIRELNIRGKVEKGKTATVEFSADRPGTYRLICENHATLQTEGPMVAELVVVHP